MFYCIFLLFVGKCGILNIFKYITFRSFCAILTTFLFNVLLGEYFICKLSSMQRGGQPIRLDGPESHIKTKSNTPTMGGILIVISTSLSTLIWGDLSNTYIWIGFATMIIFGVIGFIDDYYKLKFKNSSGIGARTKLFWQLLFSFLIAQWVMYTSTITPSTMVAIPFLKNLFVDLGLFYIPFVMIVIVGSSNAVNLTDGLDGLAIGLVSIAMTCFTIITYIVGHVVFANYLQLNYVYGVGEMCVFCSALIGASLGFLWYNSYPAKIFMGDIGSLSLGAIIGLLSVITRHELILIIIGGLFVIEAMSVILQVGSYKLRKKRIFLMAPIHHHFEKLGWSESKIVIRFWIIAIFLALIGLATLKLR